MTKRNIIDIILASGILPDDVAKDVRNQINAPCNCLTCHLQQKYDAAMKDEKTVMGDLRKMYEDVQIAAAMSENCQNLANMIDPSALLRVAAVAQDTHPQMGEALELLASTVQSLRDMAPIIIQEAKATCGESEPAPIPEPAAVKVDLN